MYIELPLANGEKKIFNNFKMTVGDFLILKRAGSNLFKFTQTSEIDVADAVETLISLMSRYGIKREEMTKADGKLLMKYQDIMFKIMQEYFNIDEDLIDKNNSESGGE